MENAIKGPVSDQQSDSIDADSGVYSREPEAPPFTIQSEAGKLDQDSRFNSFSTIADENVQASDIGLHSPEGKCESTMHNLV